MKNIFKILFLLFILSLTFIYRSNIQEFILDNFIYRKVPYTIVNNAYALSYDYEYVHKTNDLSAKNKQHILDIFYTFLNSGASQFYFYCDYDECKSDITELTKSNVFAIINNFVSPYNTYNKLHISIAPWGKIEISLDKAYSTNEIAVTDKKMNEITTNILSSSKTDVEKIKEFHDYIINTTKYDQEYIINNLNDLNNYSHRATGPLLYHKSLCGGYSHSMSLFLNMLNIPNYRISSQNHIWNLVYIDGEWKHLDLTWDDPSTTTGKDVLLDDYFLISTEKLNSYNTGHHTFDESIYSETMIY